MFNRDNVWINIFFYISYSHHVAWIGDYSWLETRLMTAKQYWDCKSSVWNVQTTHTAQSNAFLCVCVCESYKNKPLLQNPRETFLASQQARGRHKIVYSSTDNDFLRLKPTVVEEESRSFIQVIIAKPHCQNHRSKSCIQTLTSLKRTEVLQAKWGSTFKSKSTCRAAEWLLLVIYVTLLDHLLWCRNV